MCSMLNSFGPAFGTQIRTLRESAGLTQDDMARAISRAGRPWTRARYGQVESGSGAPDLEAMFAIAAAFEELSGTPVRLADLLPESGVGAELAQLRTARSGEPVHRALVTSGTASPRLSLGWGQVEDRAVEQLGAGSEQAVLDAALALWGRTGSQERNARAGVDATPQKRGRAARAIITELVEAASAAR